MKFCTCGHYQGTHINEYGHCLDYDCQCLAFTEAAGSARRFSKIEMIKLVRRNTNCGLREAKDAIDAIFALYPELDKPALRDENPLVFVKKFGSSAAVVLTRLDDMGVDFTLERKANGDFTFTITNLKIP